MSLSYQALIPTLVEDPITQINAVDRYAVLSGGNKVSWKAYNSTNIASASISFSCPPPSGGVIVNRYVKCTLPIRLSFTGNVTTSNNAFQPATSLLNAGLDAPRAFPMSGSLESLQVGLNNTSVSIPMSDVIHALLRYNMSCDLVGTNRNPLGNFASTPDCDSIQRGGFPFTIVSNATVVPVTGGTVATAVVDMVVTEPLFLSPFYWGCSAGNMQGFFNMTSMDFTLSFLANAGFRMWSHCPLVATSGAIVVNSNITGIAVQFGQFTSPAFSYRDNQPQMLFEYMSPNLLTKQQISPNVPIT